MRLFKTKRQKVDHVEFSSTGGLLAQGHEEVAYWLNPTAEIKPITFSSRMIWSATLLGENSHIGYTDTDGVHLFRLVDQTCQQVLASGQYGYSITAVGDSVFLLHGYQMPLVAYAVERFGCGQQLWPIPSDDAATLHFTSTKPVATPDGSQFLQFEFRGWGHTAGEYRLVSREAATGKVVRECRVPGFSTSGGCVAPDGKWFAQLMGESVWVLDLRSAEVRTECHVQNTGVKHFTGLAFHPSGRFLAATSNDATVKLYDTSNWSLATTYTWDVGRMRSVAFSPDGLLAAAGSDTGRVVVWDVEV